jgi:hypothetical protein
MAWETKDKVQTAIAIASIAISLFTFMIVELHSREEQSVKLAREYQFSYNLGQRFAEASQVRVDRIASSPKAEEYRGKLQRQEAWLQTVIQSSIDEHALHIETSKFLSGSSNENLNVIVYQHIHEKYGAKSAVAFKLGQDMRRFTTDLYSLWPDTATSERCGQTLVDREEALHHNLLGVDSPKNDECEEMFLNNFPSAVNPINDELQTLGVEPLIKKHPKTMDEAKSAVAETTRALESQWAQ